mgnify:CR=1 FL=1
MKANLLDLSDPVGFLQYVLKVKDDLYHPLMIRRVTKTGQVCGVESKTLHSTLCIVINAYVVRHKIE